MLREVSRKRSFVPVTVRENLTWDEVSRVEVNGPELPGVSIEMGQIRDYPFADSMAHVLGYVASVAERDLTGDPLLELPGFRIGKNGIEQKYDRSEEHTSELQSLMRISYAVFCLKKKKITDEHNTTHKIK